MLEQVARFMAEEVEPLEPGFLTRGFAAVERPLDELRNRARDMRLWAPQLPEAFGGRGLPLPDLAHLVRVLGRSMLGHYVFNCQAPDAGTMELLLEAGTSEQQELFLRPLAEGRIRSCFAMTEPNLPGSNPTWLATRARREGSDYLISGRKWFASSAEGAAFAVVMAVTDPEAPRHRRASMFLVPTNDPGFRLVENLPVMGEVGNGWASHGELELVDCRVPESRRLGKEGEGFLLAQQRLGPGRIHHCMRWLGIADRALDLLCRRAVARLVAPGQRLAEQQTIQDWIAESRIAIRAAGLLVLDAAAAVARKGSAGAREEVSGIKVYVARVMLETLDRAIQVHGALGVTDRTPLAWFWRHERAARIYDGPDEVHKRLVAREALRPYLAEVEPAP